MKEYFVVVTVEVAQFIKAHDEDEAVQMVEERLLEDHTILMDNLGYEVEEA